MLEYVLSTNSREKKCFLVFLCLKPAQWGLGWKWFLYVRSKIMSLNFSQSSLPTARLFYSLAWTENRRGSTIINKWKRWRSTATVCVLTCEGVYGAPVKKTGKHGEAATVDRPTKHCRSAAGWQISVWRFNHEVAAFWNNPGLQSTNKNCWTLRHKENGDRETEISEGHRCIQRFK